jgi:hypothetical protein
MVAARRRPLGVQELKELSKASRLVCAFRAGHPNSHPRSSNQRAGDTAGRNKETISEKVVYVGTNIVMVEWEALGTWELEIVGRGIFSQITPLRRQIPPQKYRPSLL